MASYAKGGISEWCEMEMSEFLEWIEAAKEIK